MESKISKFRILSITPVCQLPITEFVHKAAVIRDALVVTAIALLDVTTKRGGSAEQLASFTHFLDIPILLVIVSLGVLRPSGWTQFVIGGVIAVAAARC
jgi:hypothetical protein